MYGVRRSFQAVVVLFAVTFFGSPAFSQSARFFSVEARPMGVPGPASSADPCSVNENRSIAARAGDRNGSASCSHSLAKASAPMPAVLRSEEHTSELQSPVQLVRRLLPERKTVQPLLKLLANRTQRRSG